MDVIVQMRVESPARGMTMPAAPVQAGVGGKQIDAEETGQRRHEGGAIEMVEHPIGQRRKFVPVVAGLLDLDGAVVTVPAIPVESRKLVGKSVGDFRQKEAVHHTMVERRIPPKVTARRLKLF